MYLSWSNDNICLKQGEKAKKITQLNYRMQPFHSELWIEDRLFSPGPLKNLRRDHIDTENILKIHKNVTVVEYETAPDLTSSCF